MIDLGTGIALFGVLGTVIGVVWKAGKWTGKLDKSMQDLVEQQKQVNVNLSNHIKHYDSELTTIRESVARIEGRLK